MVNHGAFEPTKSARVLVGSCITAGPSLVSKVTRQGAAAVSVKRLPEAKLLLSMQRQSWPEMT